MISDTFQFKDKYGKTIFVYKWIPEKDIEVKGVVQIAHGASEHGKRYESFAEILTCNGFIVYANDHRGHGLTAENEDELGHFGDEDGWKLVVQDMHELTEIIKEENKELPIFLFGHSMGSFLSRNYIFLYGNELNGVILSGTGHNPAPLVRFRHMMALREMKKIGNKSRSYKINKLTFGSYNNKFKPFRTESDWLTRDEKEVDKYIEDKMCGQVFTALCYRDLFIGVKEISNMNNIRKTPQELPIFIISGDMDPVGNNGKGVQKVYRMYKKAGIKDLSIKLYKEGRHEILNEVNKEEVYKDIIDWIKKYA